MNEEKSKTNIPKFLWWLLGCSIFIAFLLSSIQSDLIIPSLKSISVNFSQYAWYLPGAIFLAIILKLISENGGIFEFFGIRAEIMKAKSQIEIANEKLESVTKEIDDTTESDENDLQINLSNDDDDFKKCVDDLVKEYRSVGSKQRREVDDKVRKLTDVTYDKLKELFNCSTEHQMIAAILLARFSENDEYVNDAFNELIRLTISGGNSKIRYRAAMSITSKNWKKVNNENLVNGRVKLKSRIETEPFKNTLKKLKLAYESVQGISYK